MSGLRVFATISQTGLCTPKGKLSAASGWKGRSIASEDYPLSDLVGCLIVRLHDWVGWNSKKKAIQDIDRAIEMLQSYKKDLK